MKRHGQLFTSLVCFEHLVRAARRAGRGKHASEEVAQFYFYLEPQVLQLREELEQGTYRPSPFRTFEITDPKRRTIAAAPFRDRVIHHAVCSLLEPIFEYSSIHHSYACWRGKGPQRAVRQAQCYCRAEPYYLKCDVRKFFHSVDHNVLKALIRRMVKDASFLDLLDRFIDHVPPGGQSGKGLPIGNLTSQHFANFYLSGLDHFILERLRPGGYVRYMDDLVLFGDDKRTLHNAHWLIASYLQTELNLDLKASATILAPVHQGLPFLGFRVFPSLIRLRAESLRRLRRKLKRRRYDFQAGGMTEAAFLDSTRSLIGHVLQANTRNLRNDLIGSCGLLTVNDC